MDYAAFLESRCQVGDGSGFDPVWLPDFLFGFQCHLADWSIRKGRSLVLADCGLGKGPMALVWAENVARHANRPVLLITTLGDSAQMVHEGEKFGVECVRSRDGKFPSGARVVVTNYERLHYFSPGDFAGVVCNESSCIKNFDGKRKAEVTEFLRTIPYRLLCTATAAPNDFVELGTSSEALGHLGHMDMLGRFFKDASGSGTLHPYRSHLGIGHKVGEKWRFRGHAEMPFWRWVCSWARACRKPSDLGFDDGPFVLPPLETREHVVPSAWCRPGTMFPMPARNLQEQREERRRTLVPRCELAASLVNGTGEPAVAWCHLIDEGDLLTKLIPDALQVKGGDPDEHKEEAFAAFAAGQVRVLVTKPEIGGFGLNWQHCGHQTFFPSHSFERYYQAVRRSWRFGRVGPVRVDLVTSEGECEVGKNMERKARQAERMFDRLVALMNDHMHIGRSSPFTLEAEVPAWLRKA
jgi:hypothetical protein